MVMSPPKSMNQDRDRRSQVHPASPLNFIGSTELNRGWMKKAQNFVKNRRRCAPPAPSDVLAINAGVVSTLGLAPRAQWPDTPSNTSAGTRPDP
jgi:hypothetical protein